MHDGETDDNHNHPFEIVRYLFGLTVYGIKRHSVAFNSFLRTISKRYEIVRENCVQCFVVVIVVPLIHTHTQKKKTNWLPQNIRVSLFTHFD